ncbi:hypothetical protein [Magnetofaba australis]|uniref:Peptidase M50 n=1 Tax=Magnetofaba australis IT-1 TaxID=1434232 RepID=A0A1Y2K673_9PROT|nr:hypothetical protein [Magnetofaba australis]OSM04787.1 hypothetical protein MAIT1_02877 [Magnetofaba australis IT-1]
MDLSSLSPWAPTPADNRFALIALALLAARIRRLTAVNRFLLAAVNLLGTALHELAHFLVGLLLNARPTGFSLWPKPALDGGTVLGSVSFRNLRFYNRFATAMAPTALIYLAWLFDQRFFQEVEQTIPNLLLYIAVMVLLLENAIPSTTDFRLAFANLGSLLFTALLALPFLFPSWFEPLWQAMPAF